MGITGAEQSHLRPDGGCPIGDVQHLGAGLGCNGDGQCGPPVELLGQVNDQPGLAGTGRRGDHHGWIAGPGGEQRGSQGRVGVVRRRRNRRRERCFGWSRRRAWCRGRTALECALRILGWSKVCAGPGPQPLDRALLGSGDNDVERHVPSPRNGRSSRPRARSGAQRSDDAARAGRCAAGAGRPSAVAA